MDLSGCHVYLVVGGDTGGQELRGEAREGQTSLGEGRGGEGRVAREDSL